MFYSLVLSKVINGVEQGWGQFEVLRKFFSCRTWGRPLTCLVVSFWTPWSFPIIRSGECLELLLHQWHNDMNIPKNKITNKNNTPSRKHLLTWRVFPWLSEARCAASEIPGSMWSSSAWPLPVPCDFSWFWYVNNWQDKRCVMNVKAAAFRKECRGEITKNYTNWDTWIIKQLKQTY